MSNILELKSKLESPACPKSCEDHRRHKIDGMRSQVLIRNQVKEWLKDSKNMRNDFLNEHSSIRSRDGPESKRDYVSQISKYGATCFNAENSGCFKACKAAESQNNYLQGISKVNFCLKK